MLNEFLRTLFETGQAMVGPNLELPEQATEFASCEEVLAGFEAHHRSTLPPNPPALHIESAVWAAEKLYRACQVIACREIGADEAGSLLRSENVPDSSNPRCHYSVDLTFRFLPDAFQQAKENGEQDPILDTLKKWCHTWPLSSVGISDIETIDAEVILGDPCLATMYFNRIVERRDMTRAQHPVIQTRLRKVAGNYPELVEKWTVEVDRTNES